MIGASRGQALLSSFLGDARVCTRHQLKFTRGDA